VVRHAGLRQPPEGALVPGAPPAAHRRRLTAQGALPPPATAAAGPIACAARAGPTSSSASAATTGGASVRGLYSSFTPSHRAGSGPPLVCLHGFCDTWRTWELVLPALERHHDVLALTLAGHAGGPPIEGEIDGGVLADAVERAMDEAGFELAHIVGNSLGGHVSLQLASRGRAQTVVALAPAGGWAPGDQSYEDLLSFQSSMQDLARMATPHARAVLASAEGRRRVTQYIVTRFEHIPVELLAHQMLGAASCDAASALIDHAIRDGWSVDPETITCPVRIVWGTADRLLSWPSAAARFRNDWLPHADWVQLDGIGHCPQLDIPLETAQLILGLTSR
jgi:pimeloyl-ACP methyl ester carboxylesterase